MRPCAIVAAGFVLSGCSSLYYASMEKIGREKRDILAQRVVDGRKDQEKAKRQIQTTMEAFQELTGFQGGDLEKVYKKLNGEYEDAEKRAGEVSERIRSIEKVSNDLYAEWEKEIGEIRDSSLRSSSRKMLRETQQGVAGVLKRMRVVEARMKPVLSRFRDKVLYLKHNLNARALRSLEDTRVEMDTDVDALVRDIDRSIEEADAFIAAMKAQPAS